MLTIITDDIAKMERLKTTEDAKAELKKRGLTVAKWSVQNNLPPSVVYAVLKGRLRGDYGDAHKAAVLLGIKDGCVKAD